MLRECANSGASFSSSRDLSSAAVLIATSRLALLGGASTIWRQGRRGYRGLICRLDSERAGHSVLPSLGSAGQTCPVCCSGQGVGFGLSPSPRPCVFFHAAQP